MAWNFVNDSLSTTVCLQWEPEIIAVALIHLASKLSKFTVADWIGRQSQHLRWWDMFVADVTMEILEDICHQVLDLYQSNQTEPVPESPPQLPPSKASPPMKRANLSASPPHTKSPQPPPLSQQNNNNNRNDEKQQNDGAQIPKLITDNTQMHPPTYPYPPFNPMYQHQGGGGYPNAMQQMVPGPPNAPIFNPQYPAHPQVPPHYVQPMSHPNAIPPNYYGLPPAPGRPYYHPPP